MEGAKNYRRKSSLGGEWGGRGGDNPEGGVRK